MKKYLTALAVLSLFFACAPETPQVKPDDGNGEEKPPVETPEEPGGEGDSELSVSADRLVFSSYGGSKTLTVTGPGGWTFSADKEWIGVTCNASTLTVTVAENPAEAERSGRIGVSSGGKTVWVDILQEAAERVVLDEEGQLSYTLSEGISVVPKDLGGYITSAGNNMTDATYFRVSKSAPAELLPQVPSRIVINTPCEALPDGLLANIYSMREEGDEYVFLYSDMRVTDVFKDLELDTGDLDLGGSAIRIEDADGNPVSFSRTRASTSKKIHIDFPQLSWQFLPGFYFTPKIGIDLAMKLQMSIGDWKLSTLNVKVDMDTTLGGELELKLSASREIYKKLFSIYVAAIPVGPVLITPSIDLYGVVGVDGSIGLSAQASTTIHSSAWMHYDELEGLSGTMTATDPQEGETKFGAGPKIDGGLSYGLGVGPAVGIFGDMVQAGMTINMRLREGITFAPDLISSDENYCWQGTTLFSTEFSRNLLVDAALHLRALGQTEDFTTDSMTFPLRTYKYIPPFDPAAVKIAQDGDNITFTAEITGPSVLGGDPDDGQLAMYFGFHDPAIIPFEYTAGDWEAFWKGSLKKLEVKATVTSEDLDGALHNDPHLRPVAQIAWVNSKTVVPIYNRAFGMWLLKPRHEALARAVLSDIRSCGAGWDKCNWDDDVPICLMEPLTRYGWSKIDYNPDDRFLEVAIPENWNFQENFKVNDHFPEKEDFSWGIRIDDRHNPLEFKKFEILDKVFTRVLGNVVLKAEETTIRSPKCSSYPRTSKKLDLSESGVTYLVVSMDEDYDYSSATEIHLDRCPYLMALTMQGRKDTRTQFTLTAQDSGSKEYPAGFHLDNASCPNFFQTISAFPAIDGLYVNNADAGGGLSLSDLPELERVEIINTEVGSVSLSKMPKLEEVTISHNNALSSLTLSECPALNRASIYRNSDLKCLVPDAIDDMIARGKNPYYDCYYTYTYLWSYYTGTELDRQLGEGGWSFACERVVDNSKRYYYYKPLGSGFYYSGEPGKGYHGKD